MGRKKNDLFVESALKNKDAYIEYLNNLEELALSRFVWEGLPDTVDQRFLELTLFTDGACIFFKDDVLGFLCLQVRMGGRLNVYRIPTERTAYATNGYQIDLNEENSVIIFNNYLHTPCAKNIEIFANRLWTYDRIIDINVNAQKTPILIKCDESERLTMQNLYMKYEGNQPFIFGSKDLNIGGFQVLQTGAPFVAPDLYNLKMQIWNDALTFLGIQNQGSAKRERMLSQEINNLTSGAIANRHPYLDMREQACEKINKMFGLNISVKYNENLIPVEESEVDDNE